MLQLEKFPDILFPLESKHESPAHIQRSPVSASKLERRDPFPTRSGQNSRRSRRISSGSALHRKRESNSRVVPHSQSPPDVSVHSRETCFPCTASTFKPRIDSHHGGTWDSSLVKRRGKASRESHRSLDTREGKRDTAATAREESARACPHSRRGLTPLGRLQKYPQDPCQHWREKLRF